MESVTTFSTSGFFHESPSQAPENNIRVISIFSKIHGDIRKSRRTTGINESSGKLATNIGGE
jgi:hypothetical protein